MIGNNMLAVRGQVNTSSQSDLQSDGRKIGWQMKVCTSFVKYDDGSNQEYNLPLLVCIDSIDLVN